MTPKEEAEELIFEYLEISYGLIKEFIPVPIEAAKKFELVAVDKLIKAFEFQRFEFGDDYNTTYSHYKKVKQEIIKL